MFLATRGWERMPHTGLSVARVRKGQRRNWNKQKGRKKKEEACGRGGLIGVGAYALPSCALCVCVCM